MTGLENISEEEYAHYFQKWIYTYGGASDVKTLQEFVHEYDTDLYGDINIYDNSLCPCIMCMRHIGEENG